MSVARITIICHRVVVPVKKGIARLWEAVFVLVNRIIVALAGVHAVGHTVAVRVDQNIAGIGRAVVVHIHVVIAEDATVVRVENTVSIRIVRAAVPVAVPAPGILMGTRIDPVFHTLVGTQGTVVQSGVCGGVVDGLENGISRCAGAISLGHGFTLSKGPCGPHRTHVLPDDVAGGVDFVQCALCPVGDQHVSIGQGLRTRYGTRVHATVVTPRPNGCIWTEGTVDLGAVAAVVHWRANDVHR